MGSVCWSSLFLLKIFSSFSFSISILLFLPWPSIFLLKIFSSFSFSVLLLLHGQNIFFSKYFPPFLLRSFLFCHINIFLIYFHHIYFPSPWQGVEFDQVYRSCLTCPSCPSCLFCPSFLFCLSSLWYFSPELLAKCLPKWHACNVSMVVFVRKLEVVHKQVAGCLT